MLEKLKERVEQAAEDIVYSQMREVDTPDEINRIAQEYNMEVSPAEINALLTERQAKN